jgi:hypothetical protein
MDITRQLHGRQVECVLTNGHMLCIRCTDGRELQVQWIDDNGNPMKGKPVLRMAGVHIIARGAQEILHRREAGL